METLLTIENLKQAKSLISGEGSHASAKRKLSPSTTEKTLTGLHNFSSTGWGMQQSSRESRLGITVGSPSSDSLLSNERHPQMRETFRDYLLNLAAFAEQQKEARSSYYSSTTVKNTGVQATSLGVTSILTISLSPVKERSGSPTVYKDNLHTVLIHSTDGVKSPATDSSKHDCTAHKWCWWCR